MFTDDYDDQEAAWAEANAQWDGMSLTRDDSDRPDAASVLDSISIDVEYAVRQLRQHGDVRRALDALDRIQEAIDRQGDGSPDAVPEYTHDEGEETGRVFSEDEVPF